MNLFLEKEKIEAELATVVDREAESSVKAILFTLVIVCPATEKILYADMIDALFGRRPARIIYIFTGATGETTVSVSARCKLAGGRKSVCFEEITIANGDDAIGIDPRSWAPLLVSDVPSYLLWLDGVRPIPEALARGRELTDKLLIDTSVFDAKGVGIMETYAALTCLGELSQNGECEQYDEKALLFADFSWLATNELRIVTAGVFDPPERRGLLASMAGVTLVSRKRPQAVLYFLWLASRLGWSFESKRGETFLWRDKAGDQVACIFTAEETDSYRIRFSCKDGSACTIDINETDCACTFEPNGRNESLLCSMPDAGSLLIEQTDSLVTDALFSEVVRLASEIYPGSMRE